MFIARDNPFLPAPWGVHTASYKHSNPLGVKSFASKVDFGGNEFCV